MENIASEGSENLKWSPGDIKCLVNLYKEYSTMFDRQPKKEIWKEIAEKLSSIRNKKVTGEQCDGKFKGLKFMYKKVKDHNNQSGNSSKKWEYFDMMDEVLNKRLEINPPATCSSDNADVIINIDQSNSSGIGCSSDYDFSDCIIDDTSTSPLPSALTRKRKSAEDLKQKRHEEKMEKKERFLGLFEKLVDKL